MNKTLLIFAKQPLAGKVKTRLSPPLSLQEAADVYRCMLTDTLAKVAYLPDVTILLFFEPTSGAVDFFRISFPGIRIFPQEGDCLGERLEKAFEKAFAMGFRSVAAIGTDSPDLPLSHLAEPYRLLAGEGADVVFGPAADGGYYLVASARFYPGLFRDIPWSTNRVLEKSMEAAASFGLQVVCLPVWHDMDTIADLKRFVAAGNSDYAPRTLRILHETGV